VQKGTGVGKKKRGEGTKVMAIADASGLPIAVWAGAASRHELQYVQNTVQARIIKERLRRLSAETKLITAMACIKNFKNKASTFSPHRSNRRKTPTQYGRKLRRYERRWKAERLFAWIQNFRRCNIRYDY
jgi:transposase